jgi:glycosyltransferase involved in cell wall biosynthesis
MNPILRASFAGFRTRQLQMIVAEHLRFRRRCEGLGPTLRAYARYHEQRARATRWEMSSLHTVVITTHNHAHYLPDSIESITRQDWRPLELVVVDDGSRDDTQAVLRQLLSDPPAGIDVRTIRRRRSHGQTSGVNVGVLAARGSIVTMVDADDYLLGNAIRLARESMQRHSAYLFGAQATMFWGEVPDDRTVTRGVTDLELVRHTPEHVFDSATEFNIGHTGSTFLRSAWRLVGGYRAMERTRITRASDREFQLRIASLLPVVTTSVPFGHWRQGSSVNQDRFR